MEKKHEIEHDPKTSSTRITELTVVQHVRPGLIILNRSALHC